MPFAVYGPGSLYVTRTDIANQTPYNIGFAQDLTIDVGFTEKSLYGQYEAPLAIARGTGKWTGKAKAAEVSGLALNAAFFGATFVSGSLNPNIGEVHSVVAGSATVANSATFAQDLGVVYAATQSPLQKTTSAPSVGQYSVAAGVYTFNTGDNGVNNVAISYLNNVAAAGQQLAYNAQLLGVQTTFRLDYASTFQGVPVVFQAFYCVSTKLAMNFKLEDYMIPELDFTMGATAGLAVFNVSFGQSS
jgi:hypothetical protein